MLRGSTTVTRKGQVTVPVEIRRALGLKEGDRVTFTMDNGTVRFERPGSVVERTRGIFKSNLPPMTPKEMREFAAKAMADDAFERMNR